MKTRKWKHVLLACTLITGTTIAHDVKAQMSSGISENARTGRYTEEQKVNYLIQLISKMGDATFIRNGIEHSPREAAKHLMSKWRKHKEDVQTANGFIEELASRSGLTGISYKIRFTDGTTKTTNEVLTKALQQLEEQ